MRLSTAFRIRCASYAHDLPMAAASHALELLRNTSKRSAAPLQHIAVMRNAIDAILNRRIKKL